MEAPLVRVVLVTWNSLGDLDPCLASLERYTDYAHWKLLVIDNASSDGTPDWLRRNAHAADLLLLDKNRGWVQSLNLAISKCPAEYFFFLNADTVVRPGWLGPLVAALEQDRRAAFASPRFLYPDGSIHYAGAFVGKSFAVSVRAHGEPDRGQYLQAGRVGFAHGQCLARASIFREAGLLDEAFGLGYFEAEDLQLRALRRGCHALYVPESVIVHATAKGFDQHPGGLKEQLLVQNWLRLMTVHWPPAWLLLRAPLELARPLRAVAHRRDPRPSLRAWRQWLKELPAILARRQQVQSDGPIEWGRLRDGI